jgi:thioredoxin reductase
VTSLGSIKDWGLKVEKNSVVVNSKMETNINRIYGSGDITTFDGKVNLIPSGFGEATIAVSSAKTHIDTPRLANNRSTAPIFLNKKKQKFLLLYRIRCDY